MLKYQCSHAVKLICETIVNLDYCLVELETELIKIVMSIRFESIKLISPSFPPLITIDYNLLIVLFNNMLAVLSPPVLQGGATVMDSLIRYKCGVAEGEVYCAKITVW